MNKKAHKMVFRKVLEQEARDILQSIESYSDNPRIALDQFYKYFSGKYSSKMWYGCFKNGRCMALSVLMKVPKGFILLAEIQSFIKGYGKILIKDILNKSTNIWWCADPAGGKDLVDYYRQFNLKEHLIKMSKWTNSPEYAFYKASDVKHEKKILDSFDKADMESEKYVPYKM